MQIYPWQLFTVENVCKGMDSLLGVRVGAGTVKESTLILEWCF